MRRNRHLILAAAALSTLAVSHEALAQLTLTPGSTSYTQNFDSIASGLPTGFAVATGATTSSLGAAATLNASQIAWASTAGQFGNYAAAGAFNGTESATIQNAATDRALGIRQTGTAGSGGDPGAAFELSLANTTGFQSFALDLDLEQLSSQPRSTTWTIDYRIGTSGNFTALGTFADPGAFGTTHEHFDLSGVTLLNNGGNAVVFRVAALSGSTGSGSRDTFAIDNLALTYSASTGGGTTDTATLVWNPSLSSTGGSEGSGTWDSTTSNWYSPANNANTTFNDSTPSNAVFGTGSGTGNATVTLGSDHTAGALTFSAGSATYSIVGGNLTLAGSALTASVSPGLAINAQKNATIGSNVILAGTTASLQTINVSAGATLLMTGAISGSAALSKQGSGTLTLTNTGNAFDHFSLDGGTINFSDPAQLGTFGPTFNSGTVVNTAGVTFSKTVTIGGTINWDTTAGDVTFSGHLGGAGVFNKNGPNSFVLNAPGGVMFPGVGGTININGGAIKVETDSGLAFFDTQIGGANVNINPGGVLQLDNIQSGAPDVFSSGLTPVLAGGTLIANGNVLFANGDTASFGGDTANPAMKVANGTAAAPITSTIQTNLATDVLAIPGTINQVTANSTGTFATINVTGPGRVILSSGFGVTPTTTAFAGNWTVTGGILQLGPIRPSSIFTNGNHSEPLNALGFFSGSYASGSPVTLNVGATLAIADDQANVSNTSAGASTANYIQSPVTLNGGAVASSNFELNSNGDQTGNHVSANIGGGFTVANAAGNRVLTFDPVASNNIGANNINLVAAGGTTWNGNLAVDPGTTIGGIFTINRAAGAPVSVTAGSTITVNSGSILELTGSAALSDGTHRVNVVNNSSASGMGLDVEANANGSTQIIGNLTGNGITVVGSGATLTADRVAQQSVILSGTLAVAHSATNDKANVIANVNITGGKLDLNNTDLIVTTPSAANIHSLLAAGYSGGAWNGAGGIDSTDAGANFATQHVSLGYAIPGHIGATSFDGVSLTGADANDVIVKYTYNGDGNLDGKVDLGNDFNLFLAGYLNNALLNGSDNWSLGDYNYDGVVDNSDFGMFVDGIKSQGATPLGDLDAVISSSPLLSNAQKSALLAAVPEPSSLTALALVSAGFMSRRNRRK